MSVTAAELIFFGSADMPQDSVSTTGGAIDLTTYVIPSSTTLWNTLNDKVDYLSSNAGDTSQTVTVTGRNSAGSFVSETKTLNGTSVVNGVQVFERIEKIVISGAHTGSVTVEQHTGPVTLAVLPSGVLTMRRPFYNVTAQATGGSSNVYYEKIFAKNTDSTLSLLAAQVVETANPSSDIAFALANSVNDSETTVNNLTSPVSVTAFGTTPINVPGTDLAAGAAIGIWLQLTLAAGAAAAKSSVTMELTGNSI